MREKPILVALAVVVVGCGGDAVAPDATVASIEVTTAPPTFIIPGEMVQMEAVARDVAGTALAGITLDWTSSNALVATIGMSSGLVTGVAEGETTISVTAGNETAAIPLKVTAETATYQLVFDAEWSSSTHPVSIPSNPHFSPLIGGTHGSGVAFWAVGALASPGIKAMAEMGSQTPLDSEVSAAVQAGTATSVISGGGIPLSPGSVELTFDITTEHPLATVVSMIAPSPDWFVGVRGLSLLEDGSWVDQRTVDLFAYDAGTDSGTSYTAADEATTPPDPIARITASPFDGDDRLGTFTFVRQ